MRTKPGPRRHAPLALLALLWLSPVAAEPERCVDPADPACRPQSGWVLCRAPLASPVVRPSAAERLRAELLIDASKATYSGGTRADLEDGFVMSRLDQTLSAERGRYDRAQGTFHAVGDVYYREAGLALTGSELDLDLETSGGRLEQARYALVEQHARGRADRADWDGAGRAALERATYTTCDPGDGSWLLSASRIDLDFDEGLGEAEHAVLRIKGVPILYTPWVQFPIDDRRRSGLLMPSFGNSSDNGLDLAVPWYWNIAPNRDATFTPRLLSKRGLQLATEYRYLYRAAASPQATQRGTLDFEILPDDDLFGDDRVAAQVRHEGRPWAGWQIGLDAGYVSDRDYLRDLGGDLAESNANFVERRGYVAVARPDWLLLGQFNYQQPLVDARPYQALPQLLYEYAPYGADLLRYGFDSELVRYDRADAADGSPALTGTRLDLRPWVATRLERAWGYLEPRLTLRFTGYSLDDQEPAGDRQPTRTLPQASVDGGLFFDRSALGGRFRQTLEPRLYYLHVPFEAQADLLRDSRGQEVVFDAGLPLFNWNSLFRDNRFSGVDRVADADQLTLALTSRLVDDRSGVERARFDLGQILYFRDRDVTLPGGQPETADTSPLVGRASAAFGGGLDASADLVWDPHAEQTELGTFSLSYRPDLVRMLRLAYRNNGTDIEQTDLSVSWPLSAQWHAVGRWVYSLRDQTSLETFAGFEYKSCCWAGRFLLREFVRDTLLPDDTEFALMFQLELSGLGRLGDDVTGFLSGSLPGYTKPRL